MRLRNLVAAAIVVTAAPAFAQERSGPKVGATVAAFDVQDITGPNKGKTLCYV